MADKRILWSEKEWFDVMRLAVPERDRTGKGMGGIIGKVQKMALPKVRQRSVAGFHGNSLAVMRDYEARYRAGWVPEGRLSDPATPEVIRHPEGSQKDRDAALTATFTGKNIFWTQREWAIVACAVKHRIESGDTRGLARLFFETQAEVLPRDRCRRMGGFAALPPLQAAYDAAIPNIWTLPADVVAMCEGRGKEYEAHRAKTQAGIAHQTPIAPPAIPDTVPEPIATPAAAPAPLPFLAAVEGDPLAARIVGILGEAASRIANETRAHVMAEYDRQLDRLVAALAASLREHVHGLVSAELGPLATPPAAPAAPAAPVPPTESTPEPKPTEAAAAAAAAPPPPIRVDVVGMERVGTMQVRAAADKLGIDLRLIDSDKGKTGWVPRETVILATKFIPHHVNRIAKKAGARMLFANAGPDSVIGLMESLAEHRGELQ